MGVFRSLSSLKCELKIIQARNVESKSPGAVFVRFYLSAGNSRNIELNTADISSKSDSLIWNQLFSLECQGTEASVEELKHHRIVFELRQRKTLPFWGKFCRSEMVGRGDISWESVLEWLDMETERWVVMGTAEDQILKDGKPPLLKIAFKVQDLETTKTKTTRKKKKKKKEDKKRLDDLCGCREWEKCNCADFEAFILASQFDSI